MVYKPYDIPWNGHCITLDGRQKVPLTLSEAKRLSEEKMMSYYRCNYCSMHHLSSKTLKDMKNRKKR